MLLEVSGVRSGYARVVILHDVTLTVETGELVTLFGPNGAGKSTLTKTIAGHLPVKQGEISVDGTPVHGLSAAKVASAGVGYVPQESNIFGEMTVRENLDVSALAHGHRGAQMVEPAVARFPILGERSRQRASTLSGGERQILAISSALIGEPKLLLLDEPTSGLAPSFVDIIVDWISTLVAEQGTGVLWVVEQNPAPILEVSSRTYVLEGGQINAEMPSAALLDSGRLERAILEEREILEEGAGREVDVAAMDE